MQYQHMINRNM